MRKKDDGNSYLLKLVETSSPLTKFPSTPFRIGVLGMLEEEVCRKEKETNGSPLESNPYNNPILSGQDRPTCEIVLSMDYIEANVGDAQVIEVNHGRNNLAFVAFTTDNPNVAVSDDDGDLVIEFTGALDEEVTITALYEGCLECKFSIYILATVLLEPIDPPTDPPNPEEKCRGIHVGVNERIKKGDTKTYRSTPEQNENIVRLEIELSKEGIVDIEYSTEPEFGVKIYGKEVGVVYIKFLSHLPNGVICVRVSRVEIYAFAQVAEDDGAPDGFREEDDGKEIGDPTTPQPPGDTDSPEDMDCPEEPSDEPLAHFSGGLIAYVDASKDESGYVRSWFHEPFVDSGRGADNILGEGCYPDSYAVLKNAIDTSLDSIMLKPGVRLEAWTEKNFGGTKFFDVTGKYIDGGNATGMADSSMGNSTGALDPMYEAYPQEEWVRTNLGRKEQGDPLSHDWKVASFRITKVDSQ